MLRYCVVLTDAGGVTEVVGWHGLLVLVERESTERPEAVEAGTVELVGDNPARIVEAATRLLTDESGYRRMSMIHNPYGDGYAAERIVDRIAERVAGA